MSLLGGVLAWPCLDSPSQTWSWALVPLGGPDTARQLQPAATCPSHGALLRRNRNTQPGFVPRPHLCLDGDVLSEDKQDGMMLSRVWRA